MRKNIIQFGLMAVLLASVGVAQQSSVEREGNSWTNRVTGSLAGVRILHVKVEVGAVRVEGGSSPAITYVIRNRSYESSEDRARREFESYRVSSYVRGDTGWIVGQ